MQKVCIKLNLLSLFLGTFLIVGPCFGLSESIEELALEVPMRDGVVLKTVLLRPESTQKKLPCILLRTPSEASNYRDTYGKMANWGYVVAIQSLRSFTNTDESPVPFLADGWGELQDGFDTIAWLAKSEYTDGNIGTFGPSAMGITQLLLAPTNPTHLKCQFIQVATPSLYHHGSYVGGKLCKHQMESWFAKIAPLAFENILNHPFYDEYWEQIDASKKAKDVTKPALHLGGWYDVFSQGTLDAFVSWQEEGGDGAKGQQKLIMGPWTHWGQLPEKLGEFPIPKPITQFQENKIIKEWFDYYLKGEKTALSEQPTVLYYVMGPLDGTPSKGNCWKEDKHWPPKSEINPLYLSANGTLVPTKPKIGLRKYEYFYNPEDPTLTIGGKNLYLESGPFDQSTNEKRDDVISFSTDPLEEDVEVTGRIEAEIYLSSDVPSTDLAISLTDVYPDGKSVLISEGIQTIKFTDKKPKLVPVDLWSTSIVFAKGHQIRINISSSNYPHFDKNQYAAHNAIHAGKKYPSKVLLPISCN